MFNCQTVSTFYFIEEKIYNKTYFYEKIFLLYIRMELSAPSPKNKKSHPEKISVFPKKNIFWDDC